jgi:hypothetical protein
MFFLLLGYLLHVEKSCIFSKKETILQLQLSTADHFQKNLFFRKSIFRHANYLLLLLPGHVDRLLVLLQVLELLVGQVLVPLLLQVLVVLCPHLHARGAPLLQQGHAGSAPWVLKSHAGGPALVLQGHGRRSPAV